MIDQCIAFMRRPRALALLTATIFAIVTFAVGQFIVRSLANDPQIQMAEDTSLGLMAGMPPGAITPPPGRVIGQSLSAFTVVYDAKGDAIAGSAKYKDALPKPPQGVFDYARTHGQNRITWQPEDDLRFAVAIVYYKSENTEGFVMVAKSLREAEARTKKIGMIVFFGWLATALLISLTSPTVMHHTRRIISRRKSNAKK